MTLLNLLELCLSLDDLSTSSRLFSNISFLVLNTSLLNASSIYKLNSSSVDLSWLLLSSSASSIFALPNRLIPSRFLRTLNPRQLSAEDIALWESVRFIFKHWLIALAPFLVFISLISRKYIMPWVWNMRWDISCLSVSVIVVSQVPWLMLLSMREMGYHSFLSLSLLLDSPLHLFDNLVIFIDILEVNTWFIWVDFF